MTAAASVLGRCDTLDEGVIADEPVSVGVGPLDVGLELVRLDAPLSPAADLDGAELAATYQRVDLGAGDVQDLGHVGQLEEPRRWVHTRNCATGRVWLRTLGSCCLWKLSEGEVER